MADNNFHPNPSSPSIHGAELGALSHGGALAPMHLEIGCFIKADPQELLTALKLTLPDYFHIEQIRSNNTQKGS
jgi:hypothetical protein